MTKEELEREYYDRRPTEPYSEDDSPNDWANIVQYAEENLDKAFKAIAELEEKISVLLSCKNCSENKGGWICAKEYENKCLAQKIVFIQELKKENAKLKKELKISQRCWQDQKNISLNANCSLHKAKEIIRDLLHCLPKENIEGVYEVTEEAEQFLKESN